MRNEGLNTDGRAVRKKKTTDGKIVRCLGVALTGRVWLRFQNFSQSNLTRNLTNGDWFSIALFRALSCLVLVCASLAVASAVAFLKSSLLSPRYICALRWLVATGMPFPLRCTAFCPLPYGLVFHRGVFRFSKRDIRGLRKSPHP